MKNAYRFVGFLIFCLSFIAPALLVAQTDEYHRVSAPKDALYYVKKFDGTGFIGVIVKDDGNEIVLRTEKLGKVTIPKNLIDFVERIDEKDVRISKGHLITDDFAARYFHTNSSHSLKKEQGVTVWNLWGVELQYGITDKLDVGVSTTWVGIPVGLNAKYSFELSPGITGALGTRVYTGSWVSVSSGAIYPYGSVTFGRKHTHLTLNAGFLGAYGPQADGDRAWVFGLAGKAAVTPKVDAVVEVFTLPIINTFEPVYFILPAIRINNSHKKAFQIGFAGAVSGSEAIPVPFPFIQFLRDF